MPRQAKPKVRTEEGKYPSLKTLLDNGQMTKEEYAFLRGGSQRPRLVSVSKDEVRELARMILVDVLDVPSSELNDLTVKRVATKIEEVFPIAEPIDA